MVGKLKSKLKDVTQILLWMVLKTVLKLSSLLVMPGFLVAWIPVPGTWTVSRSMRAELSYNCGVYVYTGLSSFLFLSPPTPFCSGFCFLHSLQ